jgi:hypothetical protein
LDRNWREIGSRSQLAPHLSGITKIPLQELDRTRKFQPLRYSVAQRMSWAAMRTTTRAEDRAYSLFGIFDVNLPLLYGEGGTKAFRRLQEQIMKETNDLTLFAWQSQLKKGDLGWDVDQGILAMSPREFADAGNVVSLSRNTFRSPHIGSNQEFTMTNKGLRIETPLVDLSPSGSQSIRRLFMPLNCVDLMREAPISELGILLSDAGGYGIFRRTVPIWVGSVPKDARWTGNAPVIFVAKQGIL